MNVKSGISIFFFVASNLLSASRRGPFNEMAV
jgi:hypothetical protein